MEMDEYGNGRSERLNADDYGISEEELNDAVYQQGGAINISGHYAITDVIREKLQRKIEG
jgi:hypothetical protein